MKRKPVFLLKYPVNLTKKTQRRSICLSVAERLSEVFHCVKDLQLTTKPKNRWQCKKSLLCFKSCGRWNTMKVTGLTSEGTISQLNLVFVWPLLSNLHKSLSHT